MRGRAQALVELGLVMPLLVPDTPVVTWWPRSGPSVPSGDPLGMLAQRRVTDAAAAAEPIDALAALAAGYRPGSQVSGPWNAPCSWSGAASRTRAGRAETVIVGSDHAMGWVPPDRMRRNSARRR